MGGRSIPTTAGGSKATNTSDRSRNMVDDFKSFPKLFRLSRNVIVTEKLDGSNAQIYIRPHQGNHPPPYLAWELLIDGKAHELFAGSRNRWLTKEDDNYGFWAWVNRHLGELAELGPGRHYGEWWGQGIQRNYGLTERRFSLFNTNRWNTARPACCSVVPVLATLKTLSIYEIRAVLDTLLETGSVAAPRFKDPEGVVAYHTQGNIAFKMTLNDEHKA